MKHITATIIVAMLAILIAVAAIGVVAATTNRVEKDVRITARLLENGKVEFGLQERTDGGDWSETLLPRVNKFPYATATVDRWLFSSAVALTPVEFETVQEVVGTDPVPQGTTSTGLTVSGSGQAVTLITLESGRYIVTASVTGNTERGQATNFAVWLEDTTGTAGELIANEIAAEWSGQRAVTVGGLFGLEPGTISVEVTYAGLSAQWTVEIQPIR